MNFIEYVKQIWKNGPGGGTPWSAARLNHMEDGIKNNNSMISELNNNMIYISPLVNVKSSGAKWCEIATFYYTGWNVSSFVLFYGRAIYAIEYGHELNNGYLSRCVVNNINTAVNSKRVGFKVVDNKLHIYFKSSNVFISATCIGLSTENVLTKFELKVTSLEDGDMDKII